MLGAQLATRRELARRRINATYERDSEQQRMSDGRCTHTAP